MRIAFDAKQAFSNRAGLGNFSRNTINALCCFYPENEYSLFTPKNHQGFFQPDEKIKIFMPDDFLWKMMSSVWQRKQISKMLDPKKIDIFHGLSHELPSGIEKTDTKRIVTIHDLIFIRHPEYYKTLNCQSYLKKVTYACQMADRIHAISQQTKNDIIQFFDITERKIEVIYQACNPLFLKQFSTEEKNKVIEKYELPRQFILNVGTIEKRKNLLNILKALVNYKIDVPIVVAGKETSYMLEIDDFIQKNKGKLNAIFLNKTTDKELAILYQLANMLVYPSVFEGFGLPVVEAQASGCPVITSRSSSMPEAGGQGAMYVNPVNEQEIANAILHLANDKTFRDNLIIKGKENAKRFTPEIFVKQLHKLYTRIYNV